MKAMLAYLEAARYKVQASLDEINNRPKMAHPLAKHIEVHRDKQGVPISILKVKNKFNLTILCFYEYSQQETKNLIL